MTLVATFAVVLSLGFATDLDRLSLLFSVFFAPFGAVIRWGMGLWLNHPEVMLLLLLLLGVVVVVFQSILFLFFLFFFFFNRNLENIIFLMEP